ncbi:hypothetical protein Pmani_019119 [Petrolisthes manimaculis]|uniref:Uncharacterized protein n=1 Tax=Petrolisthes manimaculis TaxID=1843537 RepID=A0AAE1PK87_9EUCA|nr:hypothetical protein Pmani_019119 [Petrolisthes manimaculis]
MAQWQEGCGDTETQTPSLHFLCQHHWTCHSLTYLIARPPIPTTGVKMKEPRHFSCFSPLFIGYKGVMVATGVALFLYVLIFTDHLSETLFDFCISEVETPVSNLKCACIKAYDAIALESLACVWTVLEFLSSVMLIVGVKKGKACLVFPACLKLSLDLNLMVLLVLKVWQFNIRLPVNLVMTFAASSYIIISFIVYSLCVLTSLFWRLLKRRPPPLLQQRLLQKNITAATTMTPITIITPNNNNNNNKEEYNDDNNDDGDRYNMDPVDKMKLIVV